MNNNKKHHKYIEKIGDRYFYTLKELQAYYNNRKAKLLGQASLNAAKIAGKAQAKTTGMEMQYTFKDKEELNRDPSYVYNRLLAKAMTYVAKKLGSSAAKAAKKVISINKEVKLRQVNNYINDRYGDASKIKQKFIKWIYGVDQIENNYTIEEESFQLNLPGGKKMTLGKNTNIRYD